MNRGVYIHIGAVLSVAVTGCASAPEYVQAPKLTDDNAGQLVVYRPKTSFDNMNASKPTVYLHGQALGQLGVGRQLHAPVPAGRHTISVKRPMFFIPLRNVGSVDVAITAQETVFVHYSYVFAGMSIAPGGNAGMTGRSTLRVVDELEGKSSR